MSGPRRWLPAALLAFLLPTAVRALCNKEPAFEPFPGNDGPGVSRSCSNDPTDASNLELYLVFSGACEQHATWYQSVVYWGAADGMRSTATATDSYTLPTGPTVGTMTFHFPVAVTALAPGKVVQAAGYAQDDENWRRLDWYVDWQQEFATSVVRVTETRTVPAVRTVTSRMLSLVFGLAAFIYGS